MLSKSEFNQIEGLASRSLKYNPQWRYGQAIFNTIHIMYPVIAKEIRATECDMFYIDSNINNFKKKYVNDNQ